MKTTLNFIPEALVDAMGWTLLHSIWQGLSVLVIAFGIIWLFRTISARKRYNILMVSLFAFIVMILLTFTVHLHSTNLADHYPVLNDESTLLMLSQLEQDVFNETSLTGLVENNTSWIVGVWLLGVIFFTLKLMGGLIYLRRIKRRAIDQIPDNWQRAFKEAAQQLNITRSIALKVSDLIDVPMVVGMLKPMVLIPTNLITGLNEEQIKSILYHELAHIKRWDYLLNMFQSIVEVIFFFNPFVWIISKYIRKEREHCCDDVAYHLSENSHIYIGALARIAEINYSTSKLSLTLAKSNNELLERIKRMTGNGHFKGFDVRGFLMLLAISVIFIFSFHAYSGRENDLNENQDMLKAGLMLEYRDNLETFSSSLQTEPTKSLQQGRSGKAVPSDTTKDERWKIEMQKMFEQRFKDFYTQNKEEVDRMIEEINVTMIKQNLQIQELSEMLEKQNEKNSLNNHLNKALLEKKQREIEKMYQELEIRARKMQLESQLQQLKARREQDIAIRKQMEAMSDQDLSKQIEKLKMVELSRAKERDMENALSELKSKEMELELERRELGIKKEKFKRKKEKYKAFEKELIQNLIKDGYIKSNEDLKTLDITGDEPFRVNGQPMKKKHKSKYRKIYEKHFGKDAKGLKISS